MKHRKSRVRKATTTHVTSWTVISNDAKRVNYEVSKESDQFVARIDQLVDLIVAGKAA